MQSQRGLSTILHCLQWYKLVLRTRLSTPAVQYLVLMFAYCFGVDRAAYFNDILFTVPCSHSVRSLDHSLYECERKAAANKEIDVPLTKRACVTPITFRQLGVAYVVLPVQTMCKTRTICGLSQCSWFRSTWLFNTESD